MRHVVRVCDEPPPHVPIRRVGLDLPEPDGTTAGSASGQTTLVRLPPPGQPFALADGPTFTGGRTGRRAIAGFDSWWTHWWTRGRGFGLHCGHRVAVSTNIGGERAPRKRDFDSARADFCAVSTVSTNFPYCLFPTTHLFSPAINNKWNSWWTRWTQTPFSGLSLTGSSPLPPPPPGLQGPRRRCSTRRRRSNRAGGHPARPAVAARWSD